MNSDVYILAVTTPHKGRVLSERQITVKEKKNMNNPGIVLQGRPRMISTPAIGNIQWYTIAEGRMWLSLYG